MKELLYPINRSLETLTVYVANNNFSFNEWPYKEILKVLTLFKERVTYEGNIEIRLLRAMKDIYVVSFRNFQGTSLYDDISNIDDQLRMLVNIYERLEPLGMDFGSGNPI